MQVGALHTNTMGMLHGGCTASLVDVLGSAAIAFEEEYECGVAASLDVQFLAPAPEGTSIHWKAEVLKRGGRLATVQVTAEAVAPGRAGKMTGPRIVAIGTVTKSLRGLSKKQSAK